MPAKPKSIGYQRKRAARRPPSFISSQNRIYQKRIDQIADGIAEPYSVSSAFWTGPES